jgi:hypothetical protein
MSFENNSDLIKKTKQLLKEYGYDVKTGHLFEVFSKLAGEKSYNVAKTKNISFEEILQSNRDSVDVKKYGYKN